MAARKLLRSRRQVCARRPMSSLPLTKFSSYIAANATAGTVADGEVRVGTNAAPGGAAASAGAVLPDGAAGAGRFTGLIPRRESDRESIGRAAGQCPSFRFPLPLAREATAADAQR
jgi:hypothetical protein